ncbi:RusA family crossover junction endodeoxyribonuclease [Marispirochaeta aestuarii]|uniref:RusA family crossover junction endodeoxyribonuclease n=1 Tax=Marispirochaeta aestuarii TaxID=1963862 RepID=UPI002ABD4698|nr:RusA family crossover junction endodeoxyribonuclease [Marispirochaeta aestuarii]
MSWKEVTSFFVAGNPRPQPRQRHRVIRVNGKLKGAGFTDPKSKVHTWKDLFALEAAKHLPEEPLSGSLKVSITFIFKRPKSHYRTGKRANELKEYVPVYHTAKPDRDNAEKAVLDILTQIGFWRDDAQVAAGEVSKIYADPGMIPGALIDVQEYET